MGGGLLIAGGLLTGAVAQATPSGLKVEVSSGNGAAAAAEATTKVFGNGEETLADAIAYLDNHGGGTITFASHLSGAVIELTASLPTITANTVIRGPGAKKLSVDGENGHETFDVPGAAALTLSGLTVEHSSGDAVFDDYGNLTITDCLLETAKHDGLHVGSYGSQRPAVTLSGDAFESNDAAGIFVSNYAALTISHSLIEQNPVGVDIYGGRTKITASSVVDNGDKSDGSGGIRDNGYANGAMTIVNSTISGNTVSNGKDSDVSGGGIALASGVSLTLIGDTVTDNHADKTGDSDGTGAAGGGISMGLIFHSASASKLTIEDSVVAANEVSSHTSERDPDISLSGMVTSFVEDSLIGTAGTAADTGRPLDLSSGVQTGTEKHRLDPKLGRLRAEGSDSATAGGALKVQEPETGSPLIGKGASKQFSTRTDPFTTDELGTPRPPKGATIGAYQVPVPKPPVKHKGK